MKCLVEVFWSEDDEGHIAVVPDLPGCSAFGATPEAAVHEIADATLAWIAACRDSGDAVLKSRGEMSIVPPELPNVTAGSQRFLHASRPTSTGQFPLVGLFKPSTRFPWSVGSLFIRLICFGIA